MSEVNVTEVKHGGYLFMVARDINKGNCSVYDASGIWLVDASDMDSATQWIVTLVSLAGNIPGGYRPTVSELKISDEDTVYLRSWGVIW